MASEVYDVYKTSESTSVVLGATRRPDPKKMLLTLADPSPGPARARLKLDLPIRPLGEFDRSGANWRLIWWPQRDETPNGIPAEFAIDF